jgi:hypothetical protein
MFYFNPTSEYWGWTSDVGVSEQNFCDVMGGTEFCDVTEERKSGRSNTTIMKGGLSLKMKQDMKHEEVFRIP